MRKIARSVSYGVGFAIVALAQIAPSVFSIKDCNCCDTAYGNPIPWRQTYAEEVKQEPEVSMPTLTANCLFLGVPMVALIGLATRYGKPTECRIADE